MAWFVKVILGCLAAVLGYGVISDWLSPPRFYGDGGDIALCILIVVCTAIVIKEIRLLNNKKDKDKETTP